MGKQAFKLIRQMIPGGDQENDLFIVGDAHQRIYDRQVVLGYRGIHIVGRGYKLRVNYRTTEENRKWAVGLLQSTEYDDLDGSVDDQEVYKSLMRGEEPEVEPFDSFQAEAEVIAEYLQKKSEEGDPLRDTCIIARTKSLLDSYRGALRTNDLETYPIRKDRAEDYQEAKDEAESARQEAELEEKRLREESGFEEWMLSAEIGELKREKDDAGALAEQEEELSDQISRINQKIDDAKREHDLEDALAGRELARAELERRRQKDLQSMVGQALADVVHRRTRNQDLPAVFERADRLFREITTDRYHLDLAREDGAFRVVTDDERRLGLSELSGGTKAQLLLAVRIAFVERQVFYLTAQSDEVAKWQGQLRGTDMDMALGELSEEEATAGGEFHRLGEDGALSSGRPT